MNKASARRAISGSAPWRFRLRGAGSSINRNVRWRSGTRAGLHGEGRWLGKSALSRSPGKPQILCGIADTERLEGFCAALFRTVRKPLILKRRDAGAVDQARLESVAL